MQQAGSSFDRGQVSSESGAGAAAWAFLQLIRLPNSLTVVADIMVGYLLVSPGLAPASAFGLLLGASLALYWSGMILNDVFDRERDRAQRPHRPLPSGRLAISTARWAGGGLLVAGVLSASWAGWVGPADLPWRSGQVATLLALLIVAYDGWLKSTWLGPLAMGGCRACNLLLGMSTGAVIRDYATPWLGYDPAQLLIAGGMGTFIAGVTWFARQEAEQPRRTGLLVGTVLMVAGLAILSGFVFTGVAQAGRYDLTIPHRLWPLIVGLLAVTVVRRAGFAIWRPSTQRVQLVVKQCLLSVIVLDAAICLAVRAPWAWSVAILSLLLPMLWLSRWFYTT